MHGKGNWKKVSELIAGKSPKQVQSHAQKVNFFEFIYSFKKYFLRQQQVVKMKRSVHDFSFEDALALVNNKKYRQEIAGTDLEKGLY